MVRRDQICALLECGVFDTSFGDGAITPAWTRPESGVSKSPLMRKLGARSRLSTYSSYRFLIYSFFLQNLQDGPSLSTTTDTIT